MATLPPIDSTLRAQLLASVAALEAERAAALARIAADQALVEQLNQRIHGAQQFLGAPTREAGVEPAQADLSPDQRAAPAPALAATTVEQRKKPGRPSTGPGPWSAFIAETLEGVNGGMNLQELQAAMQGTPWAEKHVQGRNSFYTAISKLQESGKIVRRNGVIYLPETLAKIDAGEIQEAPRAPVAEKRGAYLLITNVLREAGQSLRAGDVVDRMREIPEAQPYLRRNTQLVYATLSRMSQAGMVERDYQGFYSLPKAPAAPEPGKTLRLLQGGAGDVS